MEPNGNNTHEAGTIAEFDEDWELEEEIDNELLMNGGVRFGPSGITMACPRCAGKLRIDLLLWTTLWMTFSCIAGPFVLGRVEQYASAFLALSDAAQLGFLFVAFISAALYFCGKSAHDIFFNKMSGLGRFTVVSGSLAVAFIYFYGHRVGTTIVDIVTFADPVLLIIYGGDGVVVMFLLGIRLILLPP